MSDLTAFRDHCRKMAAAEHKLECPSLVEPPKWVLDPNAERWTWLPGPPRAACDGCVTDADRALFASLATEVDEYLDRPTDVDLFGDVSELPAEVEAP